MAGVSAGLPAGVRLSDHTSLGVIARAVPAEQVRQGLAETGKASERERALPAQVMVYYAIALALYMESSTPEVLSTLARDEDVEVRRRAALNGSMILEALIALKPDAGPA